MTEFRCGACKKLLFKGDINSAHIEVKCRCGHINKFSVNHVEMVNQQ